jgi:hypothetical protein
MANTDPSHNKRQPVWQSGARPDPFWPSAYNAQPDPLAARKRPTRRRKRLLGWMAVLVLAAVASIALQQDSSSINPVAADSKRAGDTAPAVATSSALPSAVSAAAADSTPTASGPRPANGTIFTDRGPNGHGLFTISNGTQSDAVVTIAVAEDARHSIFVQSGNAAQVKAVADGSYTIYVQQGSGWNNDLKVFTMGAQYSKFDTTATFATKRERDGIRYTNFSITLHSVPGGTADVVAVDPAAVPR